VVEGRRLAGLPPYDGTACDAAEPTLVCFADEGAPSPTYPRNVRRS